MENSFHNAAGMVSAFLAACLVVFSSAQAAPAKSVADPVAEGFPAWTGISPKNHITGRVLISDAELRQRTATIVIEFDPAKASEQLEKTGDLANLNKFQSVIGHGAANWENLQLPRDVLVVYVAHGTKTHDVVQAAWKAKDASKSTGLLAIRSNVAPVYEGVTFDGAPSNGGKFPFVYVMGFEGREPLLKEEFGPKTKANVRKIIAEQEKKIAEKELRWRPFYGFAEDAKHFGKDIEKALAKGKPLEAAEAKIKKGITSHDPETAKEAQLLYDGLVQTRGDMMWTIRSAYSACPHVAAYKISQLLKYWPKTKKQLADVEEKIKANSAAQPLIKMYSRIAQFSEPTFMCKNAGEAKKIVAELTKYKKTLEPIKEDSKSVVAQNGALILDGILDELIAIIPTKVPQK